MELYFQTRSSDSDFLQTDGIVRHRTHSSNTGRVTGRVISCVSNRRHAPRFADFIQR